MERPFSRRDAQIAAMFRTETSSSELRLLRAKFSESKPPTDPGDSLATILSERAHIADDTDQQNTVSEKPRCGITWPLVCASESDISLSEKEEVSRPSTDLSLLQPVKVKSSSSQVSHVVDELLPVLKSEQVFGRNHEEKQLLSQLLAPQPGTRFHQLSVIPIVGIGGIGKTTLARLVYEDETVQEHFELKAWVKVAGQELKQLQGTARKIIKAATGMSCPLDGLEELDEMVRDAFLSQRSLIVLDEIESMDKDSWLHMNDSWFSVVGLGSKVIITTCNKQVAEIVGSEPFELRKLSQDASWSLYSSLAFGYSKVIEDAALIPMARRLAARCMGMPLSLKLLGSLMRFEESLIEELSSGGLIMERIPNISFVLSLSVLALPQDVFKCFAYCGIFPSDYVLDKEKLIKMWIAEGFVKPSSMGMKSLEDTGDAYFHQLLCRSFFTDITCNEYGDVVQVRMPGVIHKVAQKIARTVCRDKVGYVAGVDENSDWLSVALPFEEEVYNPRHLRTLILSSAEKLDVNSNRSFVEFKRLQSLDLSSSGIRKLSDHISVLKKLRYLNLSHTLIKRLPKSLTTLVCLQTLDLSWCYYLQVLPKGISNLAQLRHLDLSQCNSLSYMPSGIGSLNSLKSMPLFVLGQKGTKGAGLGELHKLNKLGGVLHIKNLENVKEIGEAQDADLKLKKLHHLGLSWSHKVDQSLELLECLQPNPQIRVLDLTGYGAYGFPSWMPKLEGLVKLSINDCRCIKLPTLGKLRFLEELLLKGLSNIRSIGPEFYGDGKDDIFPSLKQLKLYGMPKLYNWSSATIADGSGHSALHVFPSLKTLSIQGCPQLQILPSLPSVTELVVWSSSRKILPLLTRIKSLSSLLINNMEVGESFGGLNTLSSVKKLVVVHSTDLGALTSCHIKEFTSLEHLGILHCLELETVALSRFRCLQKLKIADCETLKDIQLATENFPLTELVIEDCPRLESIGGTTSFAASLRKLIVRNCPLFSISPLKIRKLQALEYLFIGGCPQLEEWLQEERPPISHVPCVIQETGKILRRFKYSSSRRTLEFM